MHTEKREDPLVELGYEVRDLNTVAIRNASIGFFIFAIASGILGFACYRIMNPTVFAPAPKAHRIIASAPNPLLQSNTMAKTDIMDIRQHETEVMRAKVTWADDAHTHARIPLERAMELISERGLAKTGADLGPAIVIPTGGTRPPPSALDSDGNPIPPRGGASKPGVPAPSPSGATLGGPAPAGGPSLGGAPAGRPGGPAPGNARPGGPRLGGPAPGGPGRTN